MDNRELERALLNVLDKIDALAEKLDRLEKIVYNSEDDPQQAIIQEMVDEWKWDNN